jgi:hypothetical protein
MLDLGGLDGTLTAESNRRETAVAEMIGRRLDWSMLVAAGAVDRRSVPEGGYLAERHEGQQAEHAPRLEPAGTQRRINFLPAVPATSSAGGPEENCKDGYRNGGHDGDNDRNQNGKRENSEHRSVPRNAR